MTTPDAPRPAANVTDVLAAHRLTWRTSTSAVCACGEWARSDPTGGKLNAPVRREHDAHVAAILEAGPVAEAERRALCEARDALYRGEGPDAFQDADIQYGEWLGNRADAVPGGAS